MSTHSSIISTLLIALSIIVYAACAPTPPPTQTSAPTPQTSYQFSTDTKDVSALELLSQNVTLETKDFGDAGIMITGINGLMADADHYWAFYLNGEYAQQGVSQTILTAGDVVEFVYEKIDTSNF